MILHRAARTDDLLDHLATVLATPVPGPDVIEPEWLIVQSRAMERWLAQGLATRLGVWANAKVAYPAQAIDDLLRILGLAPPQRLCFGPRRLTWAVAARLVEPVDPALGPLAAYIADDEDGGRRMALARRIADAFDDYVAHRPDVVLAWQAGDDGYASRLGVPWGEADAWQPVLWRMLVADLGDAHLAALAERLAARLGDGRGEGQGGERGAGQGEGSGARSALPSRMPARLCVFAPTTLPPLHVRILRMLAQRIEVHAFVATASPSRWEAVDGWLGATNNDALLGTSTLHQPPVAAHPLVAANNRVADDLQRLLHGEGEPGRRAGRDGFHADPDGPRSTAGAHRAPPIAGSVLTHPAPPVDPEGVGGGGGLRGESDVGGGRYAGGQGRLSTPSLLTALQDDIVRDVVRGEAARLPFDAADRSIELNACHGPQREVEVLRDRLLAAFAADPTLQPDDVLVMAPDMAAYAPFVDAVFGAAPGEPGYVPIRVADRGVSAESEVFGALEAVLDVLAGRFAASAVLDLLAAGPVAERFGLGPEAADALRRWVDQAAIRWAVDAAHRASFGLPKDAANTWREGIDRLLLGWAMPDGAPPWQGALPRGSFGAADAELLGRVAEAIAVLDGLRRAVAGQRTMAGWAEDLGAVLEATVAETWRNAEEHAAVRNALEELARYAEDGGFAAPLPLGLVRGLVAGRLAEDDGGRAYLTGALTFCALLPLRGVPHRIVALLGMNDDAFPRAAHAHGFDLIARAARVGDRNQRRADRQLFLEALMAARDRLIISWAGRGMADDAERPPSTVVAELLDVADGMLVDGGAWERLVVQHARQPFSPRHFDGADARLASFAAGFVPPMEVARFAPPFVRGALGPRAGEGGTIEAGVLDGTGGSKGLSGTDDYGAPVELDALVRFLANPCRAFVGERLGLWLERAAEAGSDREPLVLEGLDAWAVGDRLLGSGLDQAEAHERAGGRLPPGVLGELAFDDIAERAARVAAAAARLGTVPADGAGRAIDVVAGARRVIGLVDGAGLEGLAIVQFGAIRPNHMLALWVRHLALCAEAAAAGGPPQRSTIVGRDGERVAFGHVQDAAERLAELLGWWRMGQALPLPLFAGVSHDYAAAIARGKDQRAARRAAEAAWDPAPRPGWTRPGDGDDPYVRQVYGGVNPFGPDALPEELPVVAAPFESVALAVWGPLLAAASAAEGDA